MTIRIPILTRRRAPRLVSVQIFSDRRSPERTDPKIGMEKPKMAILPTELYLIRTVHRQKAAVERKAI